LINFNDFQPSVLLALENFELELLLEALNFFNVYPNLILLFEFDLITFLPLPPYSLAVEFFYL